MAVNYRRTTVHCRATLRGLAACRRDQSKHRDLPLASRPPMIKPMVRLRLYQFVVASLMVILVVSPFTQQINGLDDFVTSGTDLESQAAGIFALVGLALVTVRGLLPQFPRSRSRPAPLTNPVPLSGRQVIGVDWLHDSGSEFVLLRI